MFGCESIGFATTHEVSRHFRCAAFRVTMRIRNIDRHCRLGNSPSAPFCEAKIMKSQTRWTLSLACVLVICAPPESRSQAVDKSKDDQGALKAIVEGAVGWYRLFSEPSAAEAMTPHPVLRWRNVTRGTQESEGVFVLWAANGRPEAAASIYPWEGTLNHEFVSLSRTSKLVARDQMGRAVWSPETPGIELNDLAGAAAPANTAAARLRQMKVLADRFTVIMTGWRADKSDREELRLLPKLLYRYEPGTTRAPDAGFIDGGVFAFVQGTDPEAVLLLEAVSRRRHTGWQYAFARATSGGLEARLDKSVVWAVNNLVGESTLHRPQITLRRTLGTSGSGR
jgi:hypothetical protein